MFFKTQHFAAAVFAAAILSAPAYAGFFDDVAKVITAPVRAPTEATVRILRGDRPGDILHGEAKALGNVVQHGSQAFQKAQDTFVKVQRDAIRSTLGEDWVRAYNVLTASQRVQYELALTSGRYLGKCLQGASCNPVELAAGPLAAAMRDAYKAYNGHATHLDINVQRILAIAVPLHVVQNARIVIGSTPDFTVPGMLNAGYKAFGHDHAVTLGNLMIFSRHLNFANRGDWNWLLHELRHIEQYMNFSMAHPLEAIDGFAVAYMQNWNRLEDDAQSAANMWQGVIEQRCAFGC